MMAQPALTFLFFFFLKKKRHYNGRRGSEEEFLQTIPDLLPIAFLSAVLIYRIGKVIGYIPSLALYQSSQLHNLSVSTASLAQV